MREKNFNLFDFIYAKIKVKLKKARDIHVLNLKLPKLYIYFCKKCSLHHNAGSEKAINCHPQWK